MERDAEPLLEVGKLAPCAPDHRVNARKLVCHRYRCRRVLEDTNDQQTEQTPAGYTAPVPKRDEFLGNLRKAAKPKPAQPESERKD